MADKKPSPREVRLQEITKANLAAYKNYAAQAGAADGRLESESYAFFRDEVFSAIDDVQSIVGDIENASSADEDAALFKGLIEFVGVAARSLLNLSVFALKAGVTFSELEEAKRKMTEFHDKLNEAPVYDLQAKEALLKELKPIVKGEFKELKDRLSTETILHRYMVSLSKQAKGHGIAAPAA